MTVTVSVEAEEHAPAAGEIKAMLCRIRREFDRPLPERREDADRDLHPPVG